MKFRYSRSETKEVELTTEECKEITLNYLRTLVGRDNYLRTEKGKIVVKEDDPNWRHGSVSEEYVRDATELDIAVFNMLQLLHRLK